MPRTPVRRTCWTVALAVGDALLPAILVLWVATWSVVVLCGLEKTPVGRDVVLAADFALTFPVWTGLRLVGLGKEATLRGPMHAVCAATNAAVSDHLTALDHGATRE